MAFLSPDHFLSLPRPDVTFGPPPGAPDTSTLAAHDFDVDTRTGFLPPQPPLARLPVDWEPWEAALNDALQRKLQLGDKADISTAEIESSASWRISVSQVSRCIPRRGQV
jgi:indoleamine 2,3-dioxygenase